MDFRQYCFPFIVLQQYHVHPRRASAPVAMPTTSFHSAFLDVIDKLTFGERYRNMSYLLILLQDFGH